MSQHPADRLIRELIATRRAATPDEIAQIIERMASALFDQRIGPVPLHLRDRRYQGRVLGARADRLTLHLVKRVIEERQWTARTTAAHYVRDLRQGMRDPLARLGVYERRGGTMVVILSPTRAAVPPTRLGAEPQPVLLVVYSADRSIIVTGYQVSGLEGTGIPPEARWLR